MLMDIYGKIISCLWINAFFTLLYITFTCVRKQVKFENLFLRLYSWLLNLSFWPLRTYIIIVINLNSSFNAPSMLMKVMNKYISRPQSETLMMTVNCDISRFIIKIQYVIIHRGHWLFHYIRGNYSKWTKTLYFELWRSHR